MKSPHDIPAKMRPLKLRLSPLITLSAGLLLSILVVTPAHPLQAQDKKPPKGHPSNTQKSGPHKNNAHRDGQIWAALIFATTEKTNPAPHEADKKTIVQLGKAFAGKNFQLLGEHTQQIFSEYESWVVPSKDLFLKIDSKGPTEKNDGVNLHLQLWRDKNVLLKTDVILRKEPIYITGPKWGKGQLIMVIELR